MRNRAPGLGDRLLGLLLLVLAGGGFLMLASDAMRLRGDGPTAVGTVVQPATFGLAGRDVTTVTYKTQAGQVVTADVADSADAHVKGERVTLEYDREHPSRARLTAGTVGQWVEVAWALLLAIAGAAILLRPELLHLQTWTRLSARARSRG